MSYFILYNFIKLCAEPSNPIKYLYLKMNDKNLPSELMITT